MTPITAADRRDIALAMVLGATTLATLAWLITRWLP